WCFGFISDFVFRVSDLEVGLFPPPTIRLLPYASADGPHNMAADEVMLQAAIGGLASLRFYAWPEPTLSLGYFQAERLRHDDSRLAGLPYVRRPSGGATLVHDHEITYALALPSGRPWQDGQRSGSPWLRRMHAIIANALASFGVPTRLHEPGGEQHFPGFFCFCHFSAGDVMVGSAKVVGSAQRRQRGALLQ